MQMSPRASEIFGNKYPHLFNLVSKLLDCVDGTSYQFVDPDQYEIECRRAPASGMRIYWYEIIARAHMSAVTSLARAVRWMCVMETGATQKNALALAAGARGLLESAADTIDGLGNVAQTLAQSHKSIELALCGKMIDLMLSKELEDQLIHFLYARKTTKEEEVPDSHRNKPAAKYNQWLTRPLPQIEELYAMLCQLVHPAAHSLQFCFEGTGTDFTFRQQRDEFLISQIMAQYRDTLVELPIYAVNPGLLTLSALNYFSIREFHTPMLLDWNFSGIRAWEKCVASFGAAQPKCVN